MALTNSYKRLWNPGRENIYGDDDNVLNYSEKPFDGRYQKSFEVYWNGTPEASELGGAADAVKSGVATPFQITVVSAQATDIDAGTGNVRKICLIGLTLAKKDIGAYQLGNTSSDYVEPQLTLEVVNMNGTTDVLSTRWYVRIMHAYACHWGSGGADALGAITIESPANTTLIQIAAASNESNSGILYFPAGLFVNFHHTMLGIHGAPASAGDGFQMTIAFKGFGQEGNIDADFPSLIFTSTANEPFFTLKEEHFIHRAFTDANIKYTLALITAAQNSTFHQYIHLEK